MSVRRDDEEISQFKTEMGARILEAREAAGIHVIADFSRQIEADRSTVARWESGRGCPDAVNLRNIARVTNVSVDWLMRGFAAPSWRSTYEEWAKHTNPDPQARIWIESLPLEGFAPWPLGREFYHASAAVMPHHRLTVRR